MHRDAIQFQDDQLFPLVCPFPLFFRQALTRAIRSGYQRDEDEDLKSRSHFYPPAKLEDRIDQIVVPMLAKMYAPLSIIIVLRTASDTDSIEIVGQN